MEYLIIIYNYYQLLHYGSPFFINNIEINFNTQKFILARAVQYLYDPTKYLISIYTSKLSHVYTYTLLIDLNNPHEQYQIVLANGDEPYKAVIDSLTGELYYTIRKSANFEDREIRITTDYSLIKCKENIFSINN